MARTAPVQLCWQPDRQSPVPVCRQITAYVRSQISSGAWSMGARLPSQREMARQLGVNRSTVAAAMDELVSHGVLSPCHGAGTRITGSAWSLLLPSAPQWGDYVSSGFFRANSATIQAINRLEFVPGITRLGTGEPDPRLFPAHMWSQVLSGLSRQVPPLGYLEPLGLLQLRQAVSAHMETLHIHAPPSRILITSGALQALQLISACLLGPGSTVFTEAPSYLKSLQVFQSAQITLSGVPMDNEGMRFWQLERGPLRRPGSSILYTIPTNHNPTGITMSQARRQALLEFCMASRLPMIEDGAYQELCYDGPQPLPIKAMDRADSVLYLGSASKTLAPGLRLGWMIAPEPIVQRLGDVKMQMDYGASSLSQWAFARFLSSGLYERHLSGLRERPRERRDAALEALERHFSGLATWNVPSGGFYIWLTLGLGLSTERLFHQAARQGILLNPGDLYHFARSSSLRLSFAYTSPREFDQAVGRLAQIVRQLPAPKENVSDRRGISCYNEGR